MLGILLGVGAVLALISMIPDDDIEENLSDREKEILKEALKDM